MKYLLSLFLFLFAATPVYSQTDTATVFTFVEELPQFAGGDEALIKFLQQNIKYPAVERDNNIQGKVIVRFVIMEDGSVANVEVMRGVSKGLDEEAVRVVKLMPKFKPGTQQGKPVRVYFNLPIVFKLSEPEPKDSKKKKGKK